jgi:leucyl/phenylalanyl-tRNA---protein transferase
MAIIAFPPVEYALPSGLIAYGGDLEVSSLLLAYRSGIFPWPHSSESIAWYAPPLRAILPFDEFHVSRSLLKARKKDPFTYRINTHVDRILDLCASSHRPQQEGTWITEEMKDAYYNLFKEGYVLSIGAYKDDELVGGLYGVRIGRFFAGESMFHSMNNASKLCVVELVELLKEEGTTWIDCQMLTPLFSDFGARLIPRRNFMTLLNDALQAVSSL